MGTHHGNLLKSLVTIMSRVTYFIPRANTGTCVSTNAVKKIRRGSGETNEGKCAGKVEITSILTTKLQIYTYIRARIHAYLRATGTEQKVCETENFSCSGKF